MFGIADLITCAVIKNRLEFYAKNPLHLEFVLGGFCSSPLLEMVGVDHLKHCIDFVVNNEIHVAPYYQLDATKRPSIAIVASGAENQQFIGDFGRFEQLAEKRLPPRVYASFDAKDIVNFRTGLAVSADLHLEEKLWPGLVITNGKFYATLRGVYVADGKETMIHLEEEIPEGTALNGWRAQSFAREKGIEVHSSMDAVTVQGQLATTGDPSVHRLLGVVLRSCLKSGRHIFDAYGMQVATFSYQPIVASETTELEFTSNFQIEAKFTDSWISREFDLSDPSDNLIFTTMAVPAKIVPEVKEIVIIEKG